MQNGPTPYQQTPPPPNTSGQVRMPAPQAVAPPMQSAPPRNNTTVHRQQPLPQIEAESESNFSMVDKKSARLLMAVAIGFLIFYLLVVTAKLLNEHNTNKLAEEAKQLVYAQSEATQISKTIENSLVWINNGLAEGSNPAHSARLITKSPAIGAAAILNGRNDIVASYPANSQFLRNVSLKGKNDDGVHISSIIENDGHVIPIIIKKSGSYYVVAALADNVTTNNAGKVEALIAQTGRVISGNESIGKAGPLDSFNLSSSQLGRLTKATNNFIDNQKINGQNNRITSINVPNTNLYLLVASPVIKKSALKSNLALFTTLFLGTCVLVGMLLKSLHSQLRSMQKFKNKPKYQGKDFKPLLKAVKAAYGK